MFFAYYSDSQAIEIVAAHRDSLTGVYMYLGFSVSSDGIFHPPTDEYISPHVAPFQKLGLNVGIALGLDQHAVENGKVSLAVDNITATARRNNLTSLMIDYEPKTNITSAHAHAFASAIQQLAVALHKQGVRLGMCVSSWSILTGVASIYCAAS